MRAVPILVSLDAKDRFEVRLATAPSKSFRGLSLSETIDDLALHLMERAPKLDPRALARIMACPDLSLRKVAIEGEWPLGGGKKKTAWKGRLGVVIERWPHDSYLICSVPRLTGKQFAAQRMSELTAALSAFLTELSPTLTTSKLDSARVGRDEHLEIIEVDIERPTVLSSRPKPRKRKLEPTAKAERVWVPPTTLREVSTSLGNRILDGTLPRAYGRQAIVEQIAREVQRPGAAVLLVGPSGVGKSAIIAEVARKLVDARASLTERRDFWELDGNRLIAGMSVVGAWERRVEQLVEELSSRQDVLVVDDLPTLVFTGRSAQSDTHVAGFLEPHMARGELRILAECTPERLAAARDEAPGFFGAFRLIWIESMDERESLLVLQRAVRELEKHRPVRVEPESLATIGHLTSRFAARQAQPGASVRLLRRLADTAEPKRTDKVGRKVIDARTTLAAMRKVSGLPQFVLSAEHALPTQEIREWFEHRVLAQPHATDAVVDVVCSLQQGLDDPERPVSTLLLIGPTGVGKTETAKALAERLFGSIKRLVRFDMSEFQDRGSVVRLIGGHGRPDGELTRKVSQQPFCVVLFDEIEKAHPAVFDVLLSVLGEGRLTNAVGKTTDFTSCILLLTSNLGVSEAGRHVGFGKVDPASQDKHYLTSVASFFRPEFTNRIDRIVPYRTLTKEHVSGLVERQVARLMTRRGLRHAAVMVRVDPRVTGFVVERGFDPAYGARALSRTIETELTVPLAAELVRRPPSERTFFEVFVSGGKLALEATVVSEPTDLPTITSPRADFDALAALHAELLAQLQRLTESADWSRLAAERTELLQAVTADSTVASRLEERLAWAADARRLGDRLDDLAAEQLASFRFLETVDHEMYSERRYEWQPRRVEVGVSVPVPINRRQATHELHEALTGLQIALAELRYQVHHSDQPAEPVLIRILPETTESGVLVQRLANELQTFWERWGTVDTYQHAETWQPTQELAAQPLALRICAPGAKQLMAGCAGSLFWEQSLGPDSRSLLARIECIEGEGPETLDELDAAYDAWSEGRALTSPDGPHPRPLLPLAYPAESESPDGLLTQRLHALLADHGEG